MLEKDLIQTRGFHNIIKDGKIVGFQFNVRLIYYRGIFLSQLRPQCVIVDEEMFLKENIIWSFKGENFQFEQMKTETEVHWGPEDIATIKIIKEGGLKQGYHTVKAGYRFSSSYLPPQLQTRIDDDELDPFLTLMFGQLENTRKLLLVV